MVVNEQTELTPNLGLEDGAQEAITNVLTTVLADEFILYTKLRNYHWNVVGPQFHSLHEMFEEQYQKIEPIIDSVAERIRTYGVNAIGTITEMSTHARLQEEPGVYPPARQMIMNLVADHEAMVRNLREDIDKADDLDDDGAEDFLTGLLQEHQTMAWMLRSLIGESL